VTVWPAFTEAMYLLGFSWDGQAALWEMVETANLALAPLDHPDAPRMRALMHKYRDLPMDLADAALVRVAEREKLRRIFTLDRRHFRVYRPSGIGRLSILPA
jgi:predicted nucleic acid-binding protein